VIAVIRAYILGKVNPNSERKVLDKLKKISGVKSANITFGSYDLVVRVEATDEIKLKNIVIDEIRKIPEITKTLTLIVQKV